MTIEIKKQNLFDVSEDYFLAHCISKDYALGAGIAVEFEKRFHLKSKLKNYNNGNFSDCIVIGRVFNLVTKAKYWQKPTYDSLTSALEIMKFQMQTYEIKKIAMPKIGCGLDGLQWGRVEEIIKAVFQDVNCEILVCYL